MALVETLTGETLEADLEKAYVTLAKAFLSPSAAQGPQPNLTSRIATVRGCAQSRCYASDPRRSRL